MRAPALVVAALALVDLACGPPASVVAARATRPTPDAPAPCRAVAQRLPSSASAVDPTIAARRDRVAVAWAELGADDSLRAQLLHFDGEKLVPLGAPRDVAPGWQDLGTPQVALAGSRFLVGFSGRDPGGREGIGVALVDEAGVPAPPEVAIDAPGARLGALATVGARRLLGWWQWDAERRDLHVSVASERGGRAETSATLGPASVAPAIQLAPTADGHAVDAVFTAYAKRDPEAPELVWLATLDDGGRLTAAPRSIGEGSSPSLATLPPGPPLVEWERPSDSRTWVGRPGEPGVWIDGSLGAVAPAFGGALLCLARTTHHGASAIECSRLDRAGRDLGKVVVARGDGARAIGVAPVGPDAAVTWQQDDPAGGSAVWLATVRCR